MRSRFLGRGIGSDCVTAITQSSDRVLPIGQWEIVLLLHVTHGRWSLAPTKKRLSFLYSYSRVVLGALHWRISFGKHVELAEIILQAVRQLLTKACKRPPL